MGRRKVYIYRLSALLASAALASSGVCAEISQINPNGAHSPYYLGFQQAVLYQSNVYRLGDQQVLPANLTRDDTLLGSALAGGLDLGIGRQHLSAKLNLRSNRFQHNPGLDHSGSELGLAWDWASPGHLSGRVQASAERSLAQFNSSLRQIETEKNVQSLNQFDAEIALGAVASWRLDASLGLRQRRFSAAAYAPLAFDQSSASLAITYQPGTRLNLGIGLREQRELYPWFSPAPAGGFTPNTVQRYQLDFSGFFQSSAASYFNGRLSPTHSRASQSSAHEFSGLTGSAAWTWLPGGHVKIQSVLNRDSWQSARAVDLGLLGAGLVDRSRITTGWRNKVDWRGSEKISLNLSLGWLRRDLVDNLLAGRSAVSSATAVDRTGLLEVGAKWQPWRQFEARCNLSSERRQSSDASLSTPLRSHSWGCQGQLTMP